MHDQESDDKNHTLIFSWEKHTPFCNKFIYFGTAWMSTPSIYSPNQLKSPTPWRYPNLLSKSHVWSKSHAIPRGQSYLKNLNIWRNWRCRSTRKYWSTIEVFRRHALGRKSKGVLQCYDLRLRRQSRQENHRLRICFLADLPSRSRILLLHARPNHYCVFLFFSFSSCVFFCVISLSFVFQVLVGIHASV